MGLVMLNLVIIFPLYTPPPPPCIVGEHDACWLQVLQIVNSYDQTDQNFNHPYLVLFILVFALVLAHAVIIVHTYETVLLIKLLDSKQDFSWVCTTLSYYYQH